MLESGREYADVSVSSVSIDGQKAIRVNFSASEDLHFYADGDNVLKVWTEPQPQGSSVVFPESRPYYDRFVQKTVPVYSGEFDVVVLLAADVSGTVETEVNVRGFACTSDSCLPPATIDFDFSADASDASQWPAADIDIPEAAAQPQSGPQTQQAQEVGSDSSGLLKYLLLALLAGLSFNVMPCVLPVIPIIMNRLLDQAREHRSRSITLGMAFCGGIIGFFVMLAVFGAVFQAVTGSVFQWGDQMRYPGFIAGMSLFILVMALFLFDVFAVGIPSSVSSKSGSGKGLGGSVGMGFFAALMSTPCSGAILAVVLVWTQTQPIHIGLLVFLLLGIGMALPYAVLVAFPKLLKSIPKPGMWMEHFRKAMGFVLLIIAVKLAASLPQQRLENLLLYAVFLSFAVWMWGKWVNMTTPKKKRYTIRLAAVIIAVVAGFVILPVEKDIVDWVEYDAAAIETAKQNDEPVLIKFTADWCANCKTLDKRVYKDKDVAALIDELGILAVEADTTLNTYPASIDLKEVYNEPGAVPLTVYIGNDGSVTKLRGIYSKEALLEVIDN
ncbi:protein-disulfide reductase DsbD family protein [Limihaloglobus sulfuriphilus]|nr:cytochrome c biogenesis protein CcdA [Limihaloglobus sulfuriphilus]